VKFDNSRMTAVQVLLVVIILLAKADAVYAQSASSYEAWQDGEVGASVGCLIHGIFNPELGACLEKPYNMERWEETRELDGDGVREPLSFDNPLLPSNIINHQQIDIEGMIRYHDSWSEEAPEEQSLEEYSEDEPNFDDEAGSLSIPLGSNDFLRSSTRSIGSVTDMCGGASGRICR